MEEEEEEITVDVPYQYEDFEIVEKEVSESQQSDKCHKMKENNPEQLMITLELITLVPRLT